MNRGLILVLRIIQIQISLGKKGYSFDNAISETTFKVFKEKATKGTGSSYEELALLTIFEFNDRPHINY